MAFDSFNADELMASLEASSTLGYTVESRTILHPDMMMDDGMGLDDLLSQVETPGGPTRTMPELDTSVPSQIPRKLSRYALLPLFFEELPQCGGRTHLSGNSSFLQDCE